MVLEALPTRARVLWEKQTAKPAIITSGAEGAHAGDGAGIVLDPGLGNGSLITQGLEDELPLKQAVSPTDVERVQRGHSPVRVAGHPTGQLPCRELRSGGTAEATRPCPSA